MIDYSMFAFSGVVSRMRMQRPTTTTTMREPSERQVRAPHKTTEGWPGFVKWWTSSGRAASGPRCCSLSSHLPNAACTVVCRKKFEQFFSCLMQCNCYSSFCLSLVSAEASLPKVFVIKGLWHLDYQRPKTPATESHQGIS